MLMAALALVGITGMYLHQVKRMGVLGSCAPGRRGLASAGLTLLPDPWFRLLAVPNGIAMIVLSYSLWRVTGAERTPRTQRTTRPVVVRRRVTPRDMF
jgi:hypothetical protein